MARLRILLAACASWLVACIGSNPSTPPNYANGPNYSGTPCFDNCGRDASCQANCTNSISETPLVPGGTQPGIGFGSSGPR